MDRDELMIRKFGEIEWPYAPYDPEARKQLAERIDRTGRLGTNLNILLKSCRRGFPQLAKCQRRQAV